LEAKWKKLNKDVNDKKIAIPGFEGNFWKDIKFALDGSYYEIGGFFVSLIALFFAGVSFWDSRNIGKETVEIAAETVDAPVFDFDTDRYIVDTKKELKLIVKIDSGKPPTQCNVLFLPVFIYTDENGEIDTFPKDINNFSDAFDDTLHFKFDDNINKYIAVISNIIERICSEDNYLYYCAQLKTNDVELSFFNCRLNYKIGLSNKIHKDKFIADVK